MSTFSNRSTNLWLYFLVFDSLALALSWHATLAMRVVLNPLFSKYLSHQELVHVTPPLSALILLWVLVTFGLRHSRQRETPGWGAHMVNVAQSALVAGLLVISMIFFSRALGADLSRSFTVLFFPTSLFFLILARYVALATVFAFNRTWPVTERIAVIGRGSTVGATLDRMRNHESGSISVAGIILPTDAEEPPGEWPVLGSTRQLAEIINSAHVSRVVVAAGGLGDEELHPCASVCKRMGVVFNSVVSMESSGVSLELTQLYGLNLLEVTPVPFSNHREWVKRCLDLAGASALLILLSPGLILIAALIKLTSPGPILYCSKRVGKGGRHFNFMKFRTMHTGTEHRLGLEQSNEKDGHIFKLRNDPRITSIGRVLRRWSLDELPQLVNVLTGDMSLVGPRPLPASDLDPDGQSRRFAAWAEHRSRMLPGITGLWQIRGRSDLPFHRMVELDLEYASNWSLVLDLRILLETPLLVISGRGAY